MVSCSHPTAMERSDGLRGQLLMELELVTVLRLPSPSTKWLQSVMCDESPVRRAQGQNSVLHPREMPKHCYTKHSISPLVCGPPGLPNSRAHTLFLTLVTTPPHLATVHVRNEDSSSLPFQVCEMTLAFSNSVFISLRFLTILEHTFTHLLG